MRTRTWIMVVALCGAVESQAQLSVAADVAFPSGDFGDLYTWGIGPSLGYDLDLGGLLSVFGQASYDFMMVNSDFSDVISGAYMIPYQAGLKVYPGADGSGLYGMALLGGHTTGNKVTILGVESSESSTLFSWGLGAGFRKENLDIALRYNSISEDKDVESASASTYIGLRVGFFLGGDR